MSNIYEQENPEWLLSASLDLIFLTWTSHNIASMWYFVYLARGEWQLSEIQQYRIKQLDPDSYQKISCFAIAIVLAEYTTIDIASK
jgi:hypothetical protein